MIMVLLMALRRLWRNGRAEMLSKHVGRTSIPAIPCYQAPAAAHAVVIRAISRLSVR